MYQDLLTPHGSPYHFGREDREWVKGWEGLGGEGGGVRFKLKVIKKYRKIVDYSAVMTSLYFHSI